jgi:hypothetical protein
MASPPFIASPKSSENHEFSAVLMKLIESTPCGIEETREMNEKKMTILILNWMPGFLAFRSRMNGGCSES